MPIVYTHVYIQATKTWFFTSQPNGVLRPDPAEFGVGFRGLRAIRVADELNEALAAIHLAPENGPQIPRLGTEDVLPDRVVAQAGEDVGHPLSDGAELLCDRRDEDAWFHGAARPVPAKEGCSA